MTEQRDLTAEHVAAAQLRVVLDQKLGRETPEPVRLIASYRSKSTTYAPVPSQQKKPNVPRNPSTSPGEQSTMPLGDEEAPPQSRIGVAIVDSHPMAIEGARSWLAAEPRLTLLPTGADLETLLADGQPSVDVILLDLRSGDRLVIDKVAELSRAGRRVVVYSEDTSPDTVMSLLEAGAVAFLGKHESRDHFVQSLLAAASDRPYVPPVLAGAIVADQSADRPVLSPKEREALLLWFQSMSKASVARRMRISEHAVKQYIDRARIKYTRTGRPAATKAALLARAIEDGLVRPDEIGPDARRSEPINQSGQGETA